MGKEMWTVVGAIATAFTLMFVLPVAWFVFAHGASLTQAARVHEGTKKAEVAQILGDPSYKQDFNDGSYCWFYTQATWCQIEVSFSPDGVVAMVAHDH